MKTFKYPKKEDWQVILSRPAKEKKNLQDLVSDVFSDVKQQGDQAVNHFTKKFDQVDISSLRVTRLEIEEAINTVDPKLKAAISVAIDNITKFHANQQFSEEAVETTAGVTCWRKSTPINKVGLYIPGGTAPLFSTVLMLAIPAKIAGCQEIVLCTPPNKEGKIHPAILYAADKVGVSCIVKAGGIQAIAGLTFGTESITQVYKIFGPGNQFVTAAKEMSISEGIAIDMPAGPSEVLVFADHTANPAFVAADILSQAEHGIDSQALLVCTNEKVLTQTEKEIEIQLENLPRKEIAAQALNNSTLVLIEDLDEAIALINEYAPEHFIVMCEDKTEDKISDSIVNAGSVFLGHFTPESAGDYASGTNHTLPTNGFAKAYSGVSLESFTKKITYQKITKQGLRNIGPSIEIMAKNELLDAHKNAVSIRLNSLDKE